MDYDKILRGENVDAQITELKESIFKAKRTLAHLQNIKESDEGLPKDGKILVQEFKDEAKIILGYAPSISISKGWAGFILNATFKSDRDAQYFVAVSYVVDIDGGDRDPDIVDEFHTYVNGDERFEQIQDESVSVETVFKVEDYRENTGHNLSKEAYLGAGGFEDNGYEDGLKGNKIVLPITC
jgi:hypothetical protein